MGTRLTEVSFGLAVVAAVILLVLPIYAGFEGSRATHATLLEMSGTYALLVVMFPVAVSLLPLLVRKRPLRITAALLMGAFALIGSFTIGLFYLPAAIVMFLAAGTHDCPSVRTEKHA
jgi:hypothetical protein